MDDNDTIAAHIVAKTLEHASELEAQAAMLRERIADPAFLQERVEAHVRAEQDKFSWEVQEDFPLDAPHSMWSATTDRAATGEGLTIYIYSSVARSEAEFRRKLAKRVGVFLADAARINPRLSAMSHRRWIRFGKPPAMSLLLELHANHS